MSIKDALNRVGGAYFKFENIGDSVEGEVVSAEMRQSTDYDSGQPEYFADGNPKYNIVITLSTNLRDPQNPDDDGERQVFLKAYGDDMREIKRAVVAAGDDDLNPGGYCRVTFSQTVPAQNPRHKPRKVYQVEYRKPAGPVGQSIAQDQGQPQQQFQQAAPQQGYASPTPRQGYASPTPQDQPSWGQPSVQQQEDPWANSQQQVQQQWPAQQVQQAQPQQVQPQQVQQAQPQQVQPQQVQQAQPNNGGLQF